MRVIFRKQFQIFTPANEGMNEEMSSNQAIFSTFVVIFYLLVFIKKYIPGSTAYFVMFQFDIQLLTSLMV